jgi:hypothetical protein
MSPAETLGSRWVAGSALRHSARSSILDKESIKPESGINKRTVSSTSPSSSDSTATGNKTKTVEHLLNIHFRWIWRVHYRCLFPPRLFVVVKTGGYSILIDKAIYMGDFERPQHGAGLIRRARDEGTGHRPRRRVQQGEPATLAHATAAAAAAGAAAVAEGGGGADPVHIAVISFMDAAQDLEDGEGVPIGNLIVTVHGHEEQQQVSAGFRRFVAALLGREEGGRAVRKLELVSVDWEGLPEEPVAELFGVVLPSRPTLVSISFYFCPVPPRFLEVFTASAPTELRFVGGTVDRECARAIADILLRKVPLSRLEVNPIGFDSSDAALDAESCKIICREAAKSPDLRALKIRVKEGHDDALDDVAASSSSLAELTVLGLLSDASVAGLAKQLRTNTTMTKLVLLSRTADPASDYPERFWPIASVLDTYNVTLENVELAYSVAGSAVVATINDLLRRNRGIRTALEHIQLSRGYNLAPAGLWPAALGRVRHFPTLLYRLVRKGSVDSPSDRLVGHFGGAGSATDRRRRGRSAADN